MPLTGSPDDSPSEAGPGVAGASCALLAALTVRRRIAITAKLGFMGEALRNDNRIARIQNEIERKVALQRLLVLHRNLQLRAAFDAQNVNLLRIGLRRQSAADGDGLQ